MGGYGVMTKIRNSGPTEGVGERSQADDGECLSGEGVLHAVGRGSRLDFLNGRLQRKVGFRVREEHLGLTSHTASYKLSCCHRK